MNVKIATALIRSTGATVSRRDGEWRVNVPNGAETPAYYYTDAEDAVDTAFAMMERHQLGITRVLKPGIVLQPVARKIADWNVRYNEQGFTGQCSWHNNHARYGAVGDCHSKGSYVLTRPEAMYRYPVCLGHASLWSNGVYAVKRITPPIALEPYCVRKQLCWAFHPDNPCDHRDVQS